MRLVARVALLCSLLAEPSVSAAPAFAHDQQAANPPTVRLWATREGLVGRTTASGHLITPNDHFVALPSRKALNNSVIVAYKGKSITAPVLDIGPWNRDDAWWEAGPARGQFADLPRFVPEVWAAYENGYNGGRDATGRYITFPAMIDLADGVYTDLGLQQADWVDVTLSWVDAPSPTPLAPADRKIVKRADPSPPPATVKAPDVAHDERYFSETGYRVDDDAIWSYFQARGRVPVFGFPVSRTFVLLGCQVQVFQRQVAQSCAGRGVTLMNLLDPDIFPYEKVNGSSLPPADAALKAETPQVGTPGYGAEIVDFVRTNAPDNFSGLAVAFSKTFFSLITAAVAGSDNPLFNLEVWGAPISKPRRDPGNANFVYQRFQRGVMHFDASTGRTQGLLLADYLKSILRGRDLPADLAQAARGSKYFGQYCPTSTRWLCRPSDLAATDLTYGFEPG
ncbi:MAG TPA: hypothetical protein VGQ62_05210 [Chloroflexota bacterium]|nr:hypothetical protein [Chloroflexota bacterium]